MIDVAVLFAVCVLLVGALVVGALCLWWLWMSALGVLVAVTDGGEGVLDLGGELRTAVVACLGAGIMLGFVVIDLVIVRGIL